MNGIELTAHQPFGLQPPSPNREETPLGQLFMRLVLFNIDGGQPKYLLHVVEDANESLYTLTLEYNTVELTLLALLHSFFDSLGPQIQRGNQDFRQHRCKHPW